MIIPRSGNWRSNHSSDLLGDAIRTRNIDFNEHGYITLGRKPTAIYTEHTGTAATGDGDFQDPIAIAADGTYYYVVTIDHVFGFTISETAITIGEVTTTGAPTVGEVCDATAYNAAIAVTGTATLHYLASFNGTNGSGTWTQATDFTLGASNPHPLCRFENRRTLCVGDGNKVYQTDAAAWTDDDNNELTLPSSHVVTSLRWKGNYLYIGTRTLDGSNGMVFIWNGSGTSAQAGYPVDADWVYALCEYGSSIAALTSAGQLLRFNGGGFDVLANLPVYYTPFSWSENAGASVRGKAINRGIWAIGDVIYFTIQGEPRGLFAPGAYKQPGGLWCYDPSVGLYHKAGFVTEPYRVLSISTLASSIFTMASAHGAETGDPVWASSVSNIAALTAGYVYYAIKVSSTAIKLARSPADALAGRAITASGTISGDTLAFDTLDAVGNVYTCIPGPVYGFTKNQFSPFFATEVLFSGSAQSPTNSTIASLMSLGMGRTTGSFVTPKLYGKGVKDSFQKVYSYIRGLNLDTDKVVLKYRTREEFGLPTPAVSLTWVNATSFTVNSLTEDVKGIGVGDEVEIVRGAAAGYSAHITAINDSSSTYTVTIDESIPEIAADDLSQAFINNWTKAGTVTNASRDIDDCFHEQAVDRKGSWIQFKIELRGRDVSINLLELLNAVHKP